MIAQVDPVRGKLVADTLSNWAAIQQAEQQQKQYQTHAERQQFETQREQYNRQCDQVLGPMTHAERVQAAEDLVSYLTEYGVTREQLLHESKTNLMLAHPAFNALAMDALKYRAMQKAAKPIAQKNLPPVSRPGTTPVHRSSGDVSSKIQSLQKQLETATGHKAARISAELLAAKRSAANR